MIKVEEGRCADIPCCTTHSKNSRYLIGRKSEREKGNSWKQNMYWDPRIEHNQSRTKGAGSARRFEMSRPPSSDAVFLIPKIRNEKQSRI